MSTLPSVGSVIRVRRWDDGCGGNALGHKHPWMIVVGHVTGDYVKVSHLFPPKELEWDENELDPNLDVWDVIPPEKWPKEVCVAVAKRALVGE